MQITFVTFNFKSADLDAEEKNYRDNHIEIVRQLEGIRLYYTGKLLPIRGEKPDRYRAAIVAFDDREAARRAMSSAIARPLTADTAAHLADLRTHLADAEVIVPFDGREYGRECLVMVAEFDFNAGADGIEKAEDHYLSYHVGLARRLPGLRHYIIGKLIGVGDQAPDRRRIAILTFDSLDAMRLAYRSPVGEELVIDERAIGGHPHLYRIDGRVEV